MTVVNRLPFPTSQLLKSDGTPAAGWTYTFYLSGTATLASVYTAVDLTGPTNALVLNAYGMPDVDIFLDPDVNYKLVITDDSAAPIFTYNNVRDFARRAIAHFTIYAGNPNGNVAGTAGVVGGSPADAIFDTTNSVVWVCTTTGTAGTAIWTNVTSTLSGAITFIGVLTPPSFSTQQDNYNPTDMAISSTIRLNPGANSVITGLAGGASGREIVLSNVNATYSITLNDEDGSSTAANQFLLPSGADLVIPPNCSALMRYDSLTGKWRLIGAILSPKTVVQVVPQGRLTLTTGTAVLSSDVIAATTVYYTPYNGNSISIYDGVNFITYTFEELSMAMSGANFAANAIYDLFVVNDAGTIRLGIGPAWTTATAGAGARGTGAGTTELQRVNGLWTNKVSITLRYASGSTVAVGANQGTYVGSIFMDATNSQVTCHVSYGQTRKWGVWNAYNRSPIILQMGDATASWAYGTATIRQSRATAGNTLAVFSGLIGEAVECCFTQKIETTSGGALSSALSEIGIGVNSTTAYSGQFGYTNAQNTTTHGNTPCARHVITPMIGINNVNSLEKSEATGTHTFYGTNASMLLTARWNG